MVNINRCLMGELKESMRFLKSLRIAEFKYNKNVCKRIALPFVATTKLCRR